MRTAWIVSGSVLVFATACDVAPMVPATPPPSPSSFGVAAYGDSLTSDLNGPTWPPLLPTDWWHATRAMAGERALEGSARLQADLGSGLLTTVEGDEVVVVFWGTNDVYYAGWIDAPDGVTTQGYFDDQVANHGMDPAVAAEQAAHSETATDVRDYLFAAIDQARALGLAVVLVVPPPVGAASEQPDVINPRIEEVRASLAPLAQAEGIALVDLYQAFLDQTGGFDDLLDTDGVHLVAGGRLLVEGLIQAAIQPMHDAWAIANPPPPDPPLPPAPPTTP